MIAYKVFGEDGAIAIPMRPILSEGKPEVTRDHVLPPSVVLWIPLPGPPLIRVHTCRLR